MCNTQGRRLETAGTTEEQGNHRQLQFDGGRTRSLAQRVSDFIQSATRPEALVDEFDHIADWDSDGGRLERAKFRFECDHIHIEYNLDLDESTVGIHSHNGNVSLVVDEGGDHWRDLVIDVSPDEADRIAEQLQLAAEFARQEVNADVRA